MFISTASRVWQRNSSMRRWLQSASSRVIEAGLNPPTASLSPNSPARRPSAHTRIGCPEALVIPDATADKRFAGLALVAGPPWVRFYAGTPVMAADGFAVGAVAVMDTHPRGTLSESDMWSLRDFSALVSRELNRRSSAGDASMSYAQWLSTVHPEDRDRAKAYFESFLRGVGQAVTEFRVIRPDGSVHWIVNKAQMYPDAAGEPVRVVGINLDVTNLREAERDRRELQEQYNPLLHT